MNQINRRSWIKALTTAGAGAVLLSPTEILKAMPTENLERVNGDLVRLSSNENPYSPSLAMKEALGNINSEICRYPNQHFKTLEKIIAEREGIDPAHVVVTSGSREGLKAAGMLYSLQGGEILTCLPTYKALLTYAEFIGSNIRAVPLNEDLKFDLASLKENVNDNTQLVFICNPNNPTGTLLNPNKLEEFCKETSSRVPVFVDEVYYDYIEERDYPSMKHLAVAGHDIIIARTFSKIYGLAGARIGFMIANTRIADRLRQSLMSGTNILGLRLAMAALDDKEFHSFSLEKNREAKRMIYDVLDERGLKYMKSHTNFVFFKSDREISELQSAYKSQNVVIGRAFPPYMNWCRISTGTIEEVQEFVNATKKVFA